MTTVDRRSLVLALLLSVAAMRPCLAQSTPAAEPRPQLAPEEIERFLLNAEIVASKSPKKGVTDSRRVTLSDGRFKHDAQLQDVDITMPIFQVDP
jgi:hypothetical protein